MYNIRSKIIIPSPHLRSTIEYSNMELASIYSKNENNFNILKFLLENNKNKVIINKSLIACITKLKSTSSFDAAKLLISYGANINFYTFNNFTILMDCCLSICDSDLQIINFLIENGADINIKNKFGQTALTHLMKFVKNSYDFEIIKLLIRKTNNINYGNNDFNTPLIICFKNDTNKLYRYDIIKLLLDNKADVYIKNNSGKNIFDIIKYKISKDSVKQNCENSDIYSLIFNYKNLVGLHLCEYDIDFIYNIFWKN